MIERPAIISRYRHSAEQLPDIDQWFGELKAKYKHILVCGGNHDLGLETALEEGIEPSALFKNALFIQDQAIEIEGLKLFASPWIRTRSAWYQASAFSRDEKRHHWKSIPKVGARIPKGVNRQHSWC